MKLAWWAVVRVLLTLAAAAPVAADETDRLTRTLPLAPGTAVTLQVTNGQIQVSGWDRSDLSLEIVRRAPDARALARIPPRIESSAGEVAIRILQPDGERDAALRSDVILRVPQAAELRDLSVFEGRMNIEGLNGQVSAHLERGDVLARNISGTIRVETGMGSIRFERATLSRDGLIRLRTFNGDIALELAAPPADARVLALSMGGAITSDLPLTRKDRWGPRWAEATIGSGEPLISLDVVNGNIAITVAH
jgi:DUF4097 and DUF4098 domain-containing protein YvlB